MKLEGSALIIEEKHYQDLMEIINTFAEYEIGKKNLIDFRNENNSFIENYEINQMIDQNRIRKDKLLKLLPNIRKNLR